MIKIQNITEMTAEDITNLLLDQKNQPFKINIPKSTQLYSSKNEDIAIDHAMLAYGGQLLKDSSKEFSYDSIGIEEHTSVLFTVSGSDIPKLAKAILEISIGYNNEHPDYDAFYYNESVEQFLDDSNNNKIITACPDFVEIYNDYIDKDKDKDNPLRIV